MKSSRPIYLLTLFAVCGWGLFSCQNIPEPPPKTGLFSLRYAPKKSVSNASFRGLFLVNDTIGWASGSGGTFLRMVDGENWTADTIAGYTHLDFRDVHAFDAQTAVVMAAGEEGRILRTEDGGQTWVEVYTRLDEGIFLDGMDFQGNVGFCYGDPINGKIVLIRTEDQGRKWQEIPPENLPDALENEAGFAASGTGIVLVDKDIFIGTGGDSSRVLWWKHDQQIWMRSGSFLRQGSGCGVFSMCYFDSAKLMLVGGSYLDSTNSEANSALFDYSLYDSETSAKWSYNVQYRLNRKPSGYRSCVAYASAANLLVACGRTGIDYSENGGNDWIPLSDEGYYACALADATGWVIGKRGKLAKLSW